MTIKEWKDIKGEGDPLTNAYEKAQEAIDEMVEDDDDGTPASGDDDEEEEEV